MSGTITGTDPNSGVPFSYDVIDNSLPVNTAAQNFSAAVAVAGAAKAGAELFAAPSLSTAAGAGIAGMGVAAKLPEIQQGATDLTNQMGIGPAQNAKDYVTNQIEVGMMEGEAFPRPPGTVDGNDIADPSPPAASPGVIDVPATYASLGSTTPPGVTPELDTSAGVITSPGIHGFLVPEVAGGFLHIDPGAQMDGDDGDSFG